MGAVEELAVWIQNDRVVRIDVFHSYEMFDHVTESGRKIVIEPADAVEVFE